jgi:hypothetical protein
MPAVFILAFVAFLVFVALITLIAVKVFGFRLSRDGSAPGAPGPSGSDSAGLNP